MLVLCFFFAGSGSNSTGTPPQSLPQVKVDTKGKANVAIPINLPIGTKNIQPRLSIAYHSDAGDGILGRGWQINGLHSISRNVSGGDYISSLSGKLAESNSQTSVPKNYYAKNDPFTTYVAKTSGCGDSPAICSWEATGKDGKKYYFGTSANSRIEAISSGNDANIRVWALEKVEDLNGNSYMVTYTKENGSYRPDTITYNNRKVIFGYEDKSNPYTVYTLGGKDYQTKRLKTITIKHTTNGLETTIPHGVYTFHYDTTSYKFTKTEFLNKIERSGYQDINITYHNIDRIEKGTGDITKIEEISYSTKAPVDKNMRNTCNIGALACICVAMGWSKCNDTREDDPNEFDDEETASGMCTAYLLEKDRCDNGDTYKLHKFFPADINGDGKKELFRLVGDENTDEGIILSYQKIGEGSLANYDFRDQSYPIKFNSFTAMGDVDGDGRDDFVYSAVGDGRNHTIHVAFSNGTDFDPPKDTGIETNILKYDFNLALESQATRGIQWLIDINQDGRADFVWYNNEKVHVACSDGLHFGGECDFSIQGNPLVAMADFDGNARVDFIQGTIEQKARNEYECEKENNADIYRISAYSLEQAYHGKIKSVSGGYGKQIELSYKLSPLPSKNTSSINTYPILVLPYASQVVKEFNLKHDGNVVGSNSYTYSQNRFYHSSNPEVRKLLGFSTITKVVTMGTSKSKEVSTYNQTHSVSGTLKNQKRYVIQDGTDKIVYQKETSHENVTYNRSNWLREKSFTEYHYTEDTSNPLVKQTTTFTYDGGNVEKKEISITQKSQAGITQESFSYSFEMADYNFFGKPGKIVKKANGQIVEEVSYTFDSRNNVEQKKLSISSGKDVFTNYTFDSYGNIKTKIDPNENVSTYDYDTDVHTFATMVTKSYKGKEYTISIEYDTLNGNVLSKTDTSGVTAYIDYDSYGRKLKVWYPGNPKNTDNYNEEYIYVQDGNEHSNTKIVKDGSSSGLWFKEYLDDWGRVYKTESKATSGNLLTNDSVITEDIEYYENTKLLKRKSIPYYNTSDKKFGVFEYDYLERPTKITYPDGVVKTFTYNGFVTTIDSSKTGQVTAKMNGLKQITSKIEKGITTTYTYYPSGKPEKIYTSAGDESSMTFDKLGRKLTHTTPDSGTTTFTYYPNGLKETQTDARGKVITFKYDSLNRIQEVQRADGENSIFYEYYEDGIGSLGQLKEVHDDSGTTELFYNTKGQLNAKMVKIDDYSFIFRYAYDDLNRLNKITYPNGVGINQFYSESGHLHEITMDSADGTNVGNRVVSYGINSVDHQLERLTGNNVKTTISYDINTKRPTRLLTKLANGDIVQDWKYIYKNNGLLDSVEDYTNGSDMWSGKYTQIFGYDDKDRLNSAEGYFGPNRERQTLSYNYDDKGNMDTKGDMTLTYTHSNHPHAVSSATSPSIGTINYDYDSAGNMIRRENDDFHYNSLGKLIQINKQSGEVVDYEYNYTGNRIKKSITNGASIATTYNIDGLYEVNVIPGKAVRHTLYVRGAEGDLVAQLTTENVELLTTVAEAPKTFNLDRFVTYLQMEASKFFYYTNLENPYNLKLYAFYALLIFGLLYVFSLKLVEISNQESLSTRKFSAFSMLISQLTIVAVLFSCMPKALTGSSENEDPPFWLVTSFVNGGGGIDAETPAVTDTPGSFSPGYLSGMPATGMFFIHPDHLGSTSMLTSGNGRMVAGVDINSGKSYVSYKPYGEVNKTNSSGPDIFRYKYTGQESDSETGLHYYKARYYDPMIGHFAQADTYLDRNNVMGLNQYMYTGGSPVNYFDPSGHFFVLGYFLGAALFAYGQYEMYKAIDPAGAEWVAGRIGIASADINLKNVAIAALVATAAFYATIYIGAAVGSLSQYLATSGLFGPAWFSGMNVAAINITIQYTIEGILGYYAGEFVNVIGREIGSMVDSMFPSSNPGINGLGNNKTDGGTIGTNVGQRRKYCRHWCRPVLTS